MASGGTAGGGWDRPAIGPLLAGTADARNLSDLAELLRELRRRDARERRSAPFTYRELAGKTGWSFTIISDYFTGRVLPPTDRLDDLVRLLGATPAEQGGLATARDRVEELRRRSDAAPTEKPAHPQPTVPRQLPAAVPHFTGRADELAILDGVAARAAQTGGTVLISAIEGTAGVGKTALAIHWAHRVRDRFPDGQLHVNLRGFDPGGRIVPPADALRGFLAALGVAPQGIPVGLDDRAALYRSLVADKRILVVLDNARDAEQVRPLLPGTAGCVAVVTSRNQLSGLVVVDGADPLALDLLPVAEARELLTRRLGEQRSGAEPEAVGRIAEACARLPLAITIVAAHAALHPRLPLQSVADQLSGMGERLDAFTGRDPSSDVRAVFSWSYNALEPTAARLFRLLGLHPGPDVSIPAAASLAALPDDRARKALTVLAAAHLIAEPAPGRYVLHDLLRAYAAELSHTEESQVERSAAVERMLDHYLHTAYSIALLVSPSRAPMALSSAVPGAIVEPLIDRKQGLAWLAAEHQVLIAGVELAVGVGHDFRAWALAWSIAEYLDRHGHWRVYARTQEIAREAATRLANPAALAFSHRSLSTAYIRLGRDDEALHQLQQALAVSTACGDHLGQAGAHLNIGFAHTAQRRHADALRESQRALDIFRKVGKQRGEARALNAIGWSYTQLGDHEQAIVHCTKALAVMHELDDRHGLGLTYDSLGYAYHQLGDHDQAASCFQKAIGLFSDFGDRYDQANSMARLGDVRRARGDHDAARDLYEQALAILDALGHPGAARVRDRLASPPHAAGDSCGLVRPLDDSAVSPAAAVEGKGSSGSRQGIEGWPMLLSWAQCATRRRHWRRSGDPLYDAAWLQCWWPWFDWWSDVDIEAAVGRRWRPDPGAMREYQLQHVALDSML